MKKWEDIEITRYQLMRRVIRIMRITINYNSDNHTNEKKNRMPPSLITKRECETKSLIFVLFSQQLPVASCCMSCATGPIIVIWKAHVEMSGKVYSPFDYQSECERKEIDFHLQSITSRWHWISCVFFYSFPSLRKINEFQRFSRPMCLRWLQQADCIKTKVGQIWWSLALHWPILCKNWVIRG